MHRLIPYCIVCLLVALLPWCPKPFGDVTSDTAPEWPTSFEGRTLTEIPLDSREARFAAAFPGAIAVFSDNHRRLIVRWTPVPTRRLHPAAHCFRGAGYAITPRPVFRDAEENLWGCFAARDRKDAWLVKERIYSKTDSWTDVSSWYWSVLFGKDLGPWWSLTLIEPIL